MIKFSGEVLDKGCMVVRQTKISRIYLQKNKKPSLINKFYEAVKNKKCLLSALVRDCLSHDMNQIFFSKKTKCERTQQLRHNFRGKTFFSKKLEGFL